MLKDKPNGMLANPGYLKLELLINGIRIEHNALAEKIIVKALSLSQALGTPLELDLILDSEVVVSIPVLECLNMDSPYSLTADNGKFFVSTGEGRVPVEIAAPPAFYDLKTSNGTSMGDVARAYGGYLVVSPTGKCEFIDAGMPCQYCDLETKKAPDRSVDDVVETAAAALAEGVIDSVCFNVGFTSSPDGGIKLIEKHVEAIKKRLGLLICVQAQPPASDDWVDFTYAMGVDSLAYNLEVYDPELFKAVAPGKAALIGRERYLDALKRAANVFPEGAVVSNLIVGLESGESTRKGIDYLASVGVVPTLPVMRHGAAGGPASHMELTPESVAPIFLHLQQALNRNKLAPSLISHFNMAVNAIDGQFFGGEAPVRKSLLPSMLQTSFSTKVALGIRRRLRVRTATDDTGEL